jgi:hypothetical protein
VLPINYRARLDTFDQAIEALLVRQHAELVAKAAMGFEVPAGYLWFWCDECANTFSEPAFEEEWLSHIMRGRCPVCKHWVESMDGVHKRPFPSGPVRSQPGKK